MPFIHWELRLSASFEAASEEAAVRHFGWCRLAALFVLSIVTLAGFCASTPLAVAAGRPSVRLFESSRRISVTQNELRYGSADLGFWVASVGATFR